MARYTTTIRSPWDARRAFDFMADVRNFEKWDPGVSSSEMVSGVEPGVGTEYEVTVKTGPMKYTTNEFDRPTRTVVDAETAVLTSHDVIEVKSVETGCEVTYDAVLELKGPLKLVDPLLGLLFKRIGDDAAAGMTTALEGVKVR